MEWSGEAKRRLLFVAPVMPRQGGGGLAMRAGATLAALGRRFDVQLFVVPVAGAAEPPSDFVLGLVSRVHTLDLDAGLDPHFALISRLKDAEDRRAAEALYPKPYLARYCTAAGTRYLMDWVGDDLPDAVHVMRLYLAPFADILLRLPRPGRPICVLDLDDDEVRTRRSLADLHRRRGEEREAVREEDEGTKCAAFAARYLPAFDRVTAASARDVEALGRRHPGARFVPLPNAYVAGEAPLARQPQADGKLRLLFVGTLGYFPNRDAVEFLCTEVRAALGTESDRRVDIDIAGASDPAPRQSWAEDSGIRLHGYVERLAPLYAAADVAVVPLRAGGGTRIKILEAFAHGVPVVSTTIGAEGLDVVDGDHLLIADDARSLAHACWRIKSNPGLARALGDGGARLFHNSHGPHAVATAVGALHDDAPGTKRKVSRPGNRGS